ncbi:ubiquitin-conjugating enzyme family protein, putative [Ichthyophthirius multifiliis]|uniref:Ubiquitin-conjugating enzyme family protein, putative n=1 Tax=Ichthyophthirius multifiliis TaxID=5932 RepID=G0R4S9_ICHMU|nr:ubiquitin-conjugating enzyme family protein, putative [Ichthyophthirius multifiliis]EGR27517.1 ubiquitin-conjugating enzyme family protein, putative [Ichthyophthirius multifiliis]|eukprot:XP_004024969.1 ubiquitin-conjugating enzyme family protein, putative [Ichthyophthirius multifiliis]
MIGNFNLRKIDIFGKNISIRFQQKEKHQTIFGATITFFIYIILAYLMISQFIELFQGNNPKLQYRIQYIEANRIFKIKQNDFYFALALRNNQELPVFDQKIYNITAQQVIGRRTSPESTLTYQFYDIEMEQCNTNSFGYDKLIKLFNVNFNNLYCIKNDQPIIYDIEIGGDIDNTYFSYIQINVNKCQQNINCIDKNDEKYDQYFKNPQLMIYFSDKYFDIQQKGYPFKNISRRLKFNSNDNLLKVINLYLIDNYIVSEEGIINNLKKTTYQNITYSQYEINTNSNTLFQLNIQFEDKQLNFWNRRYLKIEEVLGTLGGSFQSLFTIGIIFCYPISQFDLNRKLINQLFQFQIEKFGKKRKKPYQQQKSQIQNAKLQSNLNNIQQFNQESPKQNQFEQKSSNNCFKYKKYIKKKSIQINQQENQIQQSQSIFIRIKNYIQYSFSLLYSKQLNIENTIQAQKSNQKQNLNQLYLNSLKSQIKKIKFKFIEYIRYLYCPSKQLKIKKLQIQKGKQILYNHLDIFYIIKKITELDKLKTILLNQNQLKLFEYLPKPIIYLNKNSEKGNYQLYQEKKTEEEKAFEAFQAFQEINKDIHKQTELDKKIIEIIDPQILKSFEQQTIDQKRNNHYSPKLVEISLNNQLNSKFSRYQHSQLIQLEAENQKKQENEQNNIDEHKAGYQIDLKQLIFTNQLAQKLQILNKK